MARVKMTRKSDLSQREKKCMRKIRRRERELNRRERLYARYDANIHKMRREGVTIESLYKARQLYIGMWRNVCNSTRGVLGMPSGVYKPCSYYGVIDKIDDMILKEYGKGNVSLKVHLKVEEDYDSDVAMCESLKSEIESIISNN